MSALGKTILHQETKCCDKKIIGKEDIEDLGFFPKDCSNGAGWTTQHANWKQSWMEALTGSTGPHF